MAVIRLGLEPEQVATGSDGTLLLQNQSATLVSIAGSADDLVNGLGTYVPAMKSITIPANTETWANAPLLKSGQQIMVFVSKLAEE